MTRYDWPECHYCSEMLMAMAPMIDELENIPVYCPSCHRLLKPRNVEENGVPFMDQPARYWPEEYMG